VAKYLEQGCCPVFDIPFRPSGTGQGGDSPSIDHFDPNGSNDESNLWVISRLANTMKSNGTLDHVKKLTAWWATAQEFQRTLSMDDFFRVRDTMRERIERAIQTPNPNRGRDQPLLIILPGFYCKDCPHIESPRRIKPLRSRARPVLRRRNKVGSNSR
jgi:hypothetical protein